MPVIGIDLGTTFSAMAYLDTNGHPTTIPNAEGELTTPSAVLFEKSGDIVVGREARRAAMSEPDSVAECVKRHIGDPYYPKLINGNRFSPVEISALILVKLIQDARKKIGTIDGVVITVPAYFDEGRRQATAQAGSLAGVKVIDIINEPTSAALAYAYRGFTAPGMLGAGAAVTLPDAPSRVVLVYDLGGGTFDVTVLRIEGKNLTVLATSGDVRLGGRDWDDRLFKHMADAFIRAHGEDPREHPVSTQNLMMAAEETKKILSARRQTNYMVTHAGKQFSGEITRAQFEELTQDLLYRSENRLSRIIKQANLTWEQVDQVLAVGGSTRMPQVLEMLKRVTGREADCSLSPDEAVAQGAAIHAAICATTQSRRRPPIPTTSVPGAKPSGTRPPPPPAAAAAPSPFQPPVADLLGSIHTTNVNAHSLGVIVITQENRQRVSRLVPHNTGLPCAVKKQFGTVRDRQTVVTVRIVEGESREPDECIPVGECTIEQLPDGLPRGSPVEVTFRYDNSGRLHVDAMELTSGKRATVSIDRGAGAAQKQRDSEMARHVAQARVS